MERMQHRQNAFAFVIRADMLLISDLENPTHVVRLTRTCILGARKFLETMIGSGATSFQFTSMRTTAFISQILFPSRLDREAKFLLYSWAILGGPAGPAGPA